MTFRHISFDLTSNDLGTVALVAATSASYGYGGYGPSYGSYGGGYGHNLGIALGDYGSYGRPYVGYDYGGYGNYGPSYGGYPGLGRSYGYGGHVYH
ncbi:hypothetical protein FJT64_001931 [Amphibalanus amphitrite]|uniref:Uncharacterized protein n=1 Tax=Amphibalanus amphitrite TaxID=1232801 RepID=A0A6A4X436_AMPAM|nr:hypothetical protein FJT64_001931 [Amphibalanus amphitrite]